MCKVYFCEGSTWYQNIELENKLTIDLVFCGHPGEVDQGRADKGGSRSIAPGEPLMWPQKMLLRGKSGTSLSASFSSSSSPTTSSPASFLSSCSHSVEVNINCPLKPFIRTMAVWCQQQDWALSHCSSAMMPCFLLSQSWRSCCQNHKIYLTQLIMNVFVHIMKCAVRRISYIATLW